MILWPDAGIWQDANILSPKNISPYKFHDPCLNHCIGDAKF